MHGKVAPKPDYLVAPKPDYVVAPTPNNTFFFLPFFIVAPMPALSPDVVCIYFHHCSNYAHVCYGRYSDQPGPRSRVSAAIYNLK